MSFAFEIKKEVLEQELSLSQAQSFLSGLVSSSSIKFEYDHILKINNPKISKVIEKLMKKINIDHEHSKENKNWIILKKYKCNSEIKNPSYYFAGVFVGGGSISSIDSVSYHLEIQFYYENEAKKIQSFLNQYNFSFSLITRRKLYVLYLKKADEISDFLKAIQSFNSLMKFENARIERDLHNQLNRYSNLDVYNQQKLANASIQFKKQYLFIKEKNLQNLFNENEIAFFDLKIKNPYLSLEDLKKIYENKIGISKSKSGFNHWLRKLRKIFYSL